MISDKNALSSYEDKLAAAINHPEAYNLPHVAPVVALFLEHYRPANSRVAADCYLSSLEILDILSDVCLLSLNHVAVVMAFLGYKLNLSEDKNPEWAMDLAPR